jgi:acetoacetyl-CoA synthetase
MGESNGINGAQGAIKLWEQSVPDREATVMYKFMVLLNRKHGLQLKTYDDLHQWSIANIAAFWEEVWHFTGVRASQPYNRVSTRVPA